MPTLLENQPRDACTLQLPSAPPKSKSGTQMSATFAFSFGEPRLNPLALPYYPGLTKSPAIHRLIKRSCVRGYGCTYPDQRSASSLARRREWVYSPLAKSVGSTKKTMENDTFSIVFFIHCESNGISSAHLGWISSITARRYCISS